MNKGKFINSWDVSISGVLFGASWGFSIRFFDWQTESGFLWYILPSIYVLKEQAEGGRWRYGIALVWFNFNPYFSFTPRTEPQQPREEG